MTNDGDEPYELWPYQCGKPHDFPSGNFPYPAIGDVCTKCGIRYCPVAYDHYDPDLNNCLVCGWSAGDREG